MRKYVNPIDYFETYYRTNKQKNLKDAMNVGIKGFIVRFKIIGRVSIFPHNFSISGAILLIFSYIVEIGERYILSFLILKMKQNGAWKTKMKKYNFYSLASMQTKRISVESAILGRRENIRVYAFACLLIEL